MDAMGMTLYVRKMEQTEGMGVLVTASNGAQTVTFGLSRLSSHGLKIGDALRVRVEPA